MDTQPYNGWPNVFTWLVYVHLSSDAVLSRMATQFVAQASARFIADESLRAWVEALCNHWADSCTDPLLVTLWGGLLRAGLRQVDWRRLADAFVE